jgi:hypothetical protein
MEGGLAAEFALVVGEDGRQVEGGDGVEEEVDQIALGSQSRGEGGNRKIWSGAQSR